MKFEWDFRKAELNRKKHGVEFEEALAVFNDPNAIYGSDFKHSISERRCFVIGHTVDRLLLVIYVENIEYEVIRILSARPADRHQQMEYARQFL